MYLLFFKSKRFAVSRDCFPRAIDYRKNSFSIPYPFPLFLKTLFGFLSPRTDLTTSDLGLYQKFMSNFCFCYCFSSFSFNLRFNIHDSSFQKQFSSLVRRNMLSPMGRKIQWYNLYSWVFWKTRRDRCILLSLS